MILIYLTIFVIIFAMFNAYVILWQQDIAKQRKKWSKIWHILGRVVIGIVALWELYWLEEIHFALGIFTYLFTVFNLSWTIWDLVINGLRKANGTKISILHIDSGINATIFKILGKNTVIFWLFRGLLLLGNIILFVLTYEI